MPRSNVGRCPAGIWGYVGPKGRVVGAPQVWSPVLTVGGAGVLRVASELLQERLKARLRRESGDCGVEGGAPARGNVWGAGEGAGGKVGVLRGPARGSRAGRGRVSHRPPAPIVRPSGGGRLRSQAGRRWSRAGCGLRRLRPPDSPRPLAPPAVSPAWPTGPEARARGRWGAAAGPGLTLRSPEVPTRAGRGAARPARGRPRCGGAWMGAGEARGIRLRRERGGGRRRETPDPALLPRAPH